MKTLIKYVLTVVVVVVIADLLFGMFTRWYFGSRHLPGDYETVDYLLKKSTDDVIIVGSSVALNSVNPAVVADTIPVTMWNGASNAQSMGYFEVLIKSAFRRHKPKLLLLGLRYDETLTDPRGNRSSFLIPYYHTGYPEIDKFLEDVPPLERCMLHSSLYRYNSVWLRILLNHFIKVGEKGVCGFIGKPVPSVQPELIESTVNNARSDKSTTECFRRILDYCKSENIDVVVFFPPQYYDFNGERIVSHDELLSICNLHGITTYDVLYDTFWTQHPELFYDNRHLNVEGAKIFSSQFAGFLKQKYFNDSQEKR